jgi:uncharacterized protein YndB with AHSA1/START domain
MTVMSAVKDTEALTLVFVAEFDATPEEVWELFENPRQLEKWWGPLDYPATFVRHEFFVGGESRYFMTGPQGEIAPGWWRIESLDRATSLGFANGIAGEDGEPRPDLAPTAASVILEEVDGKTRMTVVNRFVSIEQMEQILTMGMQEGMAQALSQIDDVLARRTA